MATLFSYIHKYKNVPLTKDDLTIIDALILTGMIYLPLPSGPSNHLKEEDKVKYLLQKFIDSPIAYKECVMPLTELKFARTLVKAKRFNEIKMYGYYESINMIEQKQFRACAFVREDKSQVFISFCGTDTTLVGWKEDFNMAYKKRVPSQKLAVNYINKIAHEFPNAELFIGGHSKGGNLAMYSAVFCHKEVQDRIKYCFNFDGPGLIKEDYQSMEYKAMEDRIITIIPNYSLVGVIFGFSKDYRIIKSFGIGIYNHAFYYWQTKDKDFLYTPHISGVSAKTSVMTEKAYEDFSDEEKQVFMDAIYSMLTAGGATTTHVMNKNIITTLEGATTAYKKMSKEKQEKIYEMFMEMTSNYIRPLNEEEKKRRKYIEDNATKK